MRHKSNDMRRGGTRRQVQVAEGGFTLIELMIAVAIVAILAVVSVVAYTRYVKKGRVVEATEMLSQIQMRQESYREVNRKYCDASGDSGWSPALITGFKLRDWSPPTGFSDLGVRWEKGKVYFSYRVEASKGPAHTPDADATKLGIPAGSDAGPSQPWYFAQAAADMDNKGGTYTEFRVTSVRNQIIPINEGY